MLKQLLNAAKKAARASREAFPRKTGRTPIRFVVSVWGPRGCEKSRSFKAGFAFFRGLSAEEIYDCLREIVNQELPITKWASRIIPSGEGSPEGRHFFIGAECPGFYEKEFGEFPHEPMCEGMWVS